MSKEYIAHTETNEETGVTLKIVQDQGSSSLDPTKRGDDAIIITVLHTRCRNPGKDAGERLDIPDLVTYDEDGTPDGTKTPDFNDRDDLKEFVRKHCNSIDSEWTAFPLFMLDHSGVSYSIKPFGCKWDSGQVGFVFVKRNDTYDSEKAARVAIQEYSDWAGGNVWGYVVENSDGDTLDACWGFIGDSDSEYLMGEALSAFKQEIIQEKKRIAGELERDKQRARDVETVRRFLKHCSDQNWCMAETGITWAAFNRIFPT